MRLLIEGGSGKCNSENAPGGDCTSHGGDRACLVDAGIEVYGNCQTPSVEPTEIVLACADYNAILEALHWTSWTATSATAVGTLVYNDCTPNCAEGHFHHVPGTRVTLTVPSRENATAGSMCGPRCRRTPNPQAMKRAHTTAARSPSHMGRSDAVYVFMPSWYRVRQRPPRPDLPWTAFSGAWPHAHAAWSSAPAGETARILEIAGALLADEAAWYRSPYARTIRSTAATPCIQRWLPHTTRSPVVTLTAIGRLTSPC